MALELHPGEHVIFDGHPVLARRRSASTSRALGARALGAAVAALVDGDRQRLLAGRRRSLVFVVLCALVILVGFV